MIAKIVTAEKREYFSTVFAIYANGWETAVIVFDDENYEFAFVKMYGHGRRAIPRRVFILDCDDKDFEKDKTIRINALQTIKNVSGYDWLVNDTELISAILKKQPVDSSVKERAKEFNRRITQNEWTWVKNEQDVENLMAVSWGFHDGTIDRILFDAQTESVTVIFSGCWAAKMTLIFQGEPMIHTPFGADYGYCIMDSTVFFEDGFVYWVDDDSIKSEKTLKECSDVNYFRARSLKWKQETEFLSQEDDPQ